LIRTEFVRIRYEDLDPAQEAEADRRAVDPPIEVESATWSAGARATRGLRKASSGWVGYAGQTVASGGSKPLIFVRQIARIHKVRASGKRGVGKGCPGSCIRTSENSPSTHSGK
jgi:hypothetical protein